MVILTFVALSLIVSTDRVVTKMFMDANARYRYVFAQTLLCFGLAASTTALFVRYARQSYKQWMACIVRYLMCEESDAADDSEDDDEDLAVGTMPYEYRHLSIFNFSTWDVFVLGTLEGAAYFGTAAALSNVPAFATVLLIHVETPFDVVWGSFLRCVCGRRRRSSKSADVKRTRHGVRIACAVTSIIGVIVYLSSYVGTTSVASKRQLFSSVILLCASTFSLTARAWQNRMLLKGPVDPWGLSISKQFVQICVGAVLFVPFVRLQFTGSNDNFWPSETVNETTTENVANGLQCIFAAKGGSKSMSSNDPNGAYNCDGAMAMVVGLGVVQAIKSFLAVDALRRTGNPAHVNGSATIGAFVAFLVMVPWPYDDNSPELWPIGVETALPGPTWRHMVLLVVAPILFFVGLLASSSYDLTLSGRERRTASDLGLIETKPAFKT